MSLPYSSSTPAVDGGKREECLRAGAAVRLLLERDIRPRDIMTRKAFENALAVLMVLGGSTNAVLHLIAMARAVDVPLTLGSEGFQLRRENNFSDHAHRTSSYFGTALFQPSRNG